MRPGRSTAAALALLVALPMAGCQRGEPTPSTPPSLVDTLRVMAAKAGSQELLSFVQVTEESDRVVLASFKVGSKEVALKRANNDAPEPHETNVFNEHSATFTMSIDDVEPARVDEAAATPCPEPVPVHVIALPNGHQQLVARCQTKVVKEMVDDKAMPAVEDHQAGPLATKLVSITRELLGEAPFSDAGFVVQKGTPILTLTSAKPVGKTFTDKPCHPEILLASGEGHTLDVSCNDDSPEDPPQPLANLDAKVLDSMWTQLGKPKDYFLKNTGTHWWGRADDDTDDSRFDFKGKRNP